MIFTGMVLDLKWNKKKNKFIKFCSLKTISLIASFYRIEGANQNSETRRYVQYLRYVKKGRVIEDLVNSKILFVDKDGKLLEKRAEKSRIVRQKTYLICYQED